MYQVWWPVQLQSHQQLRTQQQWAMRDKRCPICNAAAGQDTLCERAAPSTLGAVPVLLLVRHSPG